MHLVANEPVHIGSHVHTATEEFPDLTLEGEDVQPSVRRIEVNQQIDVAVRSGIAPNDRSEDADVGHTPLLRQVENLPAMSTKEGERRSFRVLGPDVHDSIVRRPRVLRAGPPCLAALSLRVARQWQTSGQPMTQSRHETQPTVARSEKKSWSGIGALGGTRTPNLLIRRRVPPSQTVPPAPPVWHKTAGHGGSRQVSPSRWVPPVPASLASTVTNRVASPDLTPVADSARRETSKRLSQNQTVAASIHSCSCPNRNVSRPCTGLP